MSQRSPFDGFIMCKVEVLFGVEAEVVIEVEVKDFDTFSNLNFIFDKVCTLSLSVHRKSEEDNK